MRILLRLAICLLPLAAIAQEGDRSSSSRGGSARSDDYVLQPLDLLQIRVFQEEDMDREVRMSRESVVFLPLIGRVSFADKTIREAEDLVRELYDRDFLVNPQINLTVLEYARRTVNVLGSVTNPGEIEFPREEGLTLLDAVSRAGGFSRLADRKKVRLTRQIPGAGEDETENFIINADDIIDGDSSKQWVLETGDLIYIPERFL